MKIALETMINNKKILFSAQSGKQIEKAATFRDV